MTDILPGYTWSRARRRYISQRTGRPISEAELRRLFNERIADAEGRMADIATAYYEGKISPALFVELMATEQRRLTVQSAALGKGGFDELDAAALVALALLLRETNERIIGTAHDALEGKVSLPQLVNRADGYVGEARREFFRALRDAAIASAVMGGDSIILARRMLDPRAKHCRDCPDLAARGWSRIEELPPPGYGCQCAGHCRCGFLTMTVPRDEAHQWIGTLR